MLVFSRFCKCLFSQQLVLTPSPALAPSNADTRVHRASDYPIAVVIDKEDEEATKSSTAAKSSTVTKSSAAIKSSVGMDERMTDKVKRAMNKKIMEKVLQKIPLYKAVLSVHHAFGMKHWKEFFSQMKNNGKYLSVVLWPVYS